MDSLTAARIQMGFSLGFHMIFAAFGIGMPLLMLIAEGLWLKTGKEHYLTLAKKWGKVTGLLFAIGAVSGTALSFELGLLWPRFMEFAGSIIGPAFAMEGFAFFIEAIFLGLYLYGWNRLSPLLHWLTGIPVAISGMASGVLVVAVNAWMQTPVGFEVDASGQAINVDPIAPFLSPSWIPMAIHSTLSCYIAVGFAVAGVYAVGMLRGNREPYHFSALNIAMAVGMISAVLQPLSGDILGKNTAEHNPVKMAAMEAHYHTQKGAPIVLGGIPDDKTGEVHFGIPIPYMLSIMVKMDPNAEVKGLFDLRKEGHEWPNVLWVHLSFQVMVGCGMMLIAVGAWYWWSRWRKKTELGKWLLIALALASPLGMIALEAGWMVTELGRQPWTIVGVKRTADVVTPADEVFVSMVLFTALYWLLAIVLVILLRRMARKPVVTSDAGTPESA